MAHTAPITQKNIAASVAKNSGKTKINNPKPIRIIPAMNIHIAKALEA